MSEEERRIPVALICNSLPPYRVHLHLRVARELPQLRAWTLRSHREDPRWAETPPELAREIGLISLDTGVYSHEQSLPASWLREWKAGGRLIDFIRREKIRAVVMVGYNDPGRLRLMLWCRRHHVPMLVWGDSNLHDEDIRLKNRPIKSLFKKMVLRILLRFPAGILCFGTAGRAFFEYYGARPDRIFYYPLEPDYAAIRALPAEAVDNARMRFGLAAGRHRLVFCGRLIPLKKVGMLLAAFGSIASQRPDWDLVILGGGPMDEELQSAVPADLRHRVIWTGHVSDQNAVRAVQRCCDVLVITSEREAWGLVVNEALAAGLPVVSTDIVGAAIDLIRDGVNGRTFPRDDQARLTECLLDVTDEQRLAEMSIQAPIILEEWIRRADPIAGLQKALAAVGVECLPAAVPCGSLDTEVRAEG